MRVHTTGMQSYQAYVAFIGVCVCVGGGGLFSSVALGVQSSYCPASIKVPALLGRLILIGIVASFGAALPITFLSKLQARDFHKVDEIGGKEWERRLSIWRTKDRMLWAGGVIYSAFCLLYITLFFANVKQGSHGPWLASAFITLLTDFLLAPLAVVLAPSLLAVVFISFLTFLLWKSREEVVEKLAMLAAEAGQNSTQEDESDSVEVDRESSPPSDQSHPPDERRTADQPHNKLTTVLAPDPICIIFDDSDDDDEEDAGTRVEMHAERNFVAAACERQRRLIRL